jgi:hypothetical protein
MPWGAPDPGTAYVTTCDAGGCDEDTVAVVQTGDGWLSMCLVHALFELAAGPGD